jgi:5-(carboxyamino)imidazole ribonucleotide mutase
MENVLVGIVMGSESDLPIMKAAAEFLKELGIGSEIIVASAHRSPELAADFAKGAEGRGLEVIIAGAGMAAHLPGVLAAFTTLPVIGVPIKSGALNGMDALLAIAQMPPGVPVATVAVNGGKNAGILAAQIIAVKQPEIRQKLKEFKAKMAEDVAKKSKIQL